MLLRGYTILFTLLIMSELSAQVKRMEPPFWWSGMHRQQLEILFYGDNISRLEPFSKDIDILEARRTSNPNYLFLTVDCAGQKAGIVQIEFNNKGETMFTVDYEFRARRTASAERNGFDASDVIYLIMPDRFANGDPSRDTHPEMQEVADRSEPGGRHGGDIRGIINRLDYIKELGATAIWSTPMCEDNDARALTMAMPKAMCTV